MSMECPYSFLTGTRVTHSSSQILHEKAEDVVFDHKDGGYHFFAICDGHGGKNCASFVKENLWTTLKPNLPDITLTGTDDRIPSTPSPHLTLYDLEVFEIMKKIREALIYSVLSVDEAWYENKEHSGTTVTIVLVTGRLVTVANVGDSYVYFYDGNQMYEVSKDHRLDNCIAERQRLIEAGLELAPLCAQLDGPARLGDPGYGPLRVWPGGLAVSRSLGDRDVTPHVLCVPHVRQFIVPDIGARLIMASDGIWDALRLSKVKTILRGKSLMKCSEKLVNLVYMIQSGELVDDTSTTVIDVIPEESLFKDFKYVLKDMEKGGLLRRIHSWPSKKKKAGSASYTGFLADVDGISILPEDLIRRSLKVTEEGEDQATICPDRNFTVSNESRAHAILFSEEIILHSKSSSAL